LLAIQTIHRNHGYRSLWEALKDLFKKETKKLEARKKVRLTSFNLNDNSGGMKMTKKPTNETTTKKAMPATKKPNAKKTTAGSTLTQRPNKKK